MIYLKRLYQPQPGPAVSRSQWLQMEQEGDDPEPLVRHLRPAGSSRTAPANTQEVVSFGVYLKGEERDLSSGRGVDYFASREGEEWYGPTTVRLAFDRMPLDEVEESIRLFCEKRLNEASGGSWMTEIFGGQVWDALLAQFPSAGLLGYSCFVPD